jgi:hypothetical protein
MDNAEVYELSKDDRALIYQHIDELQKSAPGFGPITVHVLRNDAGEFELTLSTQDGLQFDSVGRGPTVYEASLMAQQALSNKLRLVLSASGNSPERAMQIFSILHGNTLH